MARKIYTRFYIPNENGPVLTDLGEKFKERWLEAHGDGTQNTISKEFGISIPTLYRMRKDLGLPDLHSKEHPGRKAFHKRVIELYRRFNSSERVARTRGIEISGQRVIQILRENKVTIGPQHIASPLLYSPVNGMTAGKFNETVKRLYEDGVSAKQIAETIGVDQGTVSKRIKCMNISLRQNHRAAPGGYPCLWCAKVMETVWIASGERKQRFCGASCKNRAKDLRKYLAAARTIKRLRNELQRAWGASWKEQEAEIVRRQCANRAGGRYFPSERRNEPLTIQG